MTSQAEYKVICFHECVTGNGATRGGAMRPQPGNTCIQQCGFKHSDEFKYDIDVL